MTRGATLLAVKALERDGERWIEGWATTGREDRVGDIVEPTGAKYLLPLPLLFAHKHDEPIGSVVSATVTKAGIRIRAKLTAGVARAEEVWKLIQDGALTAVSIGFRALKQTPLSNGGLRFDEWEWHELSVVSVPANPDARIAVGKSVAYRAQSAPQPTPPAPRVVPLPAYVPCADLEQDFQRACDSLPASIRKQVSDLRSHRVPGRWTLCADDGSELAVVPRPMAQDFAHKQVQRDSKPQAPQAKPQGLTKAQAAQVTTMLRAVVDGVGSAIGQTAREIDTKLAQAIVELSDRLDKLEADSEEKGIRFRGYYRDRMSFTKGDATTHDGSLWIAVRGTDEAPAATSPDWCLAARKGRDAK